MNNPQPLIGLHPALQQYAQPRDEPTPAKPPKRQVCESCGQRISVKREPPPDEERCKALTKAGTRCVVRVSLHGDGYCPQHHYLHPSRRLDPRVLGVMGLSIEVLDLSERPRNCLRRAQIETVGDLLERTPDDLLNITNFGQESLDEVTAKLAKFGESLLPEDPAEWLATL